MSCGGAAARQGAQGAPRQSSRSPARCRAPRRAREEPSSTRANTRMQKNWSIVIVCVGRTIDLPRDGWCGKPGLILCAPSSSTFLEAEMSNDRKIIAVIGATGAQGGGLVRAILADPAGGFAVRALTRGPNRQGEGARPARRRGRSRDLDDAASLERAFGARTARSASRSSGRTSRREGARRGAQHGRRGARAGVKHVIWSTLEDTRKWVPLDDPHADAEGQVQGAALRRQGRSEPFFRARRADHVPADVVLLGQPDPLRHGADARRGRQARLHAADGRQEASRHRRRGHRRCAYGIFKRAAASSSARPSASRAST